MNVFRCEYIYSFLPIQAPYNNTLYILLTFSCYSELVFLLNCLCSLRLFVKTNKEVLLPVKTIVKVIWYIGLNWDETEL